VFIDDDDLAHPDLVAQYRLAAIEDRVAVITCGIRLVTPDGQTVQVRLPEDGGSLFENTVLCINGAPCIRRDIFHAVGGYRPSQTTSHHTELWFRVLPLVQRSGLVGASIQRVLYDIATLPPNQRRRNDPARLRSGTEYLLRTYDDRLRRHKPTYARFASIAGAAAARLGDFPGARRWFLAAAIADPRTPKNVGRLVCSAVPPIARRVWPAT
jgi:hypothetical protein